MQKKDRAKIEIVFAALVLIMSLVAFLTLNGSLAWFAHNTSVGATGLTVSVKSGTDVTATLSSYPILQIENGAYTIAYTDEKGNPIEAYTLPTDDPNGISYSRYKKALAVILDVSCEYQTHVSVELTATTLAPSIAESNYISNCIAVAPASLNSDKTVATVDGSFYTFTKVADGVCTKPDLTLDLVSATLPAGGGKLCFILQYNEDFLHYVTTQVMANNLNYFELTYYNDVYFTIFQ